MTILVEPKNALTKGLGTQDRRARSTFYHGARIARDHVRFAFFTQFEQSGGGRGRHTWRYTPYPDLFG